jgi:hypothetical protein
VLAADGVDVVGTQRFRELMRQRGAMVEVPAPVVAIDHDVELITEQIKALKELAQEDAETPISEGHRYDFSIRWGTVLAGRLHRLVHYSSLGLLDDADERRFRAARRTAHAVAPNRPIPARPAQLRR